MNLSIRTAIDALRVVVKAAITVLPKAGAVLIGVLVAFLIFNDIGAGVDWHVAEALRVSAGFMLMAAVPYCRLLHPIAAEH